MLSKITLQLYNDDCEIIVNQFAAASASLEVNYKNNKLFAFFSVEKASETAEASDVKNIKVIYTEKSYAIGRIPGARARREILPSDKEILIARLVDRSVRTYFPRIKHLCEINLVLVNDAKNIDAEILAIFTANIMLKMLFQERYSMSMPIKFYISPASNQIAINQQIDKACCSILMASTASSINIMELKTSSPIEVRCIMGYLTTLVSKIKQQINIVDQAIEGIKMTKFPLEETENYTTYSVHKHDELNALKLFTNIVLYCPDMESYDQVSLFREKLSAILKCDEQIKEVYLNYLVQEVIRNYYIDKQKRLDNRAFDELRPISIVCNYIHNAHSSVLLQRGNTQVLSTSVIAGFDMRVMDTNRNLYVQYIFPLFAVQEVSKSLSIKRREIGHGYIAEDSLRSVVDESMVSNNSIRIANDILSADGSTSIASTIASSLVSLQLGINIDQQFLSGVGIGAIYSRTNGKKKIIIISDINKIEDNFGALDMKIIFNNKNQLVYIQLDVKEEVDIEDIYQCIQRGQSDSSKYCEQIQSFIATSKYNVHGNIHSNICIDVPAAKITDGICKKMYLNHRAKVIVRNNKVYLYCDSKTIRNTERSLKNLITGIRTR